MQKLILLALFSIASSSAFAGNTPGTLSNHAPGGASVSGDSDLKKAVEVAAASAKKLGYGADLSGKTEGKVVVTASSKSGPVTLKMQIRRKDGKLVVSKTGSADSAIEQKFYQALKEEAGKNKLSLVTE
jgi:hypothetical protein